MLESTLTSLLVSVAGRYAHLSASDVGVGLSGGRLILDNVQLRADAFNSPALPCCILHGRAGRLRVNVPWSALSHAPVTVYLENIHLVAGPKIPTDAHGQSNNPGREESTGGWHGTYPDVESEEGETSARGTAGHAPTSALGREKDGRFRERWHETLVGRLGFNVAVEVYGLKLEYRDDKTQGIVSLASCKAYSADRNWEPAFAPLDAEETGAVAMRKIVSLKGLHCVMLPRADPGDDERLRSRDSEQQRRREYRRKQLGGENDSEAGGPSFGQGEEAAFDVDAFESRNPILDGIGVTFKILLCNSDGPEDGWHLDLDVELEEPLVNLSARQFEWIRGIHSNWRADNLGGHFSSNSTLDAAMPKGASHTSASGAIGTAGEKMRRGGSSRRGRRGPSRRRVAPTTSTTSTILKPSVPGEDSDPSEGVHHHGERTNWRKPGFKGHEAVKDPSGPGLANTGDIPEGLGMQNASETEDQTSPRIQLLQSHQTRRLGGVFPRVLSDSSSYDDSGDDEFVDAGYADNLFGSLPHILDPQSRHKMKNFDGSRAADTDNGAWHAETTGAAKEATETQRGSGLSSLWRAIVGEENVDETVDDAAVALGYATTEIIEAEKRAQRMRDAAISSGDRSEQFEALKAVALASEAGGYTLRLRVTTPDFQARENVAELKSSLLEERRARSRLEDVENVLAQSDDRLAAANDEIVSLRERNASLVRELDDLERMTRTASSSKDVMVRQMEAALRKAEQQLQSIAQAHAARQLASVRNEGSAETSFAGAGRRQSEPSVPKEAVSESSSSANPKRVGAQLEASSRGPRLTSTIGRPPPERGTRGTGRRAGNDGRRPAPKPVRAGQKDSVQSGDAADARTLEEDCSKDGLTVV